MWFNTYIRSPGPIHPSSPEIEIMINKITAHVGVNGFEYATAYIGTSSTFADLETAVRAQLAGGQEVTVRFEAVTPDPERITVDLSRGMVEVPLQREISDHENGDHDDDPNTASIAGCGDCMDMVEDAAAAGAQTVETAIVALAEIASALIDEIPGYDSTENCPLNLSDRWWRRNVTLEAITERFG